MGTKTKNPLRELLEFGQSVWLDYIRRDLFTSGELERLVNEDGLRGMTSNPSIFEKAITGSTDYAQELQELAKRKDLDAKGVYERLAINDIQQAADVLKPVYVESKMRDGYVSLGKFQPGLAHKTAETIEEARRLWKAVGRENVMIKVPGTDEGIPAFQQLISEGINVNVTLLFAQDVYEQVAEAYIVGLEAFAKSGGEVSRIASVASFFVSRIDVLIDGMIAGVLKDAGLSSDRQALLLLAAGESGDCECETCIPILQENFRRTPLAGTRVAERTDAARALGQHLHEKSRLSRRAVRRRAYRSRYGEHDSSRHIRRVPQSRPRARELGRRR